MFKLGNEHDVGLYVIPVLHLEFNRAPLKFNQLCCLNHQTRTQKSRNQANL